MKIYFSILSDEEVLFELMFLSSRSWWLWHGDLWHFLSLMPVDVSSGMMDSMNHISDPCVFHVAHMLDLCSGFCLEVLRLLSPFGGICLSVGHPFVECMLKLVHGDGISSHFFFMIFLEGVVEIMLEEGLVVEPFVEISKSSLEPNSLFQGFNSCLSGFLVPSSNQFVDAGSNLSSAFGVLLEVFVPFCSSSSVRNSVVSCDDDSE